MRYEDLGREPREVFRCRRSYRERVLFLRKPWKAVGYNRSFFPAPGVIEESICIVLKIPVAGEMR